MKRLLIGVAAVAIFAALTPANAQVYLGADPGGVGVQVGPLGVGVGPDYWGDPGWRHRHWREHYAYAEPECRVIRTRVQTPHGHLIWRTQRVCD
jgi:hypothetical protein